jgi:kynurenine formamidase
MPVYPGTEPPKIETSGTVEKDGFYERKLTFLSHTGTHIDAPAHLLPHAPTLDMAPVGNFAGPGSVIDLTGIDGKKIELSDLEPFEHLFKASDFILLRTGWSRFWGQETYFEDYPVLSVEAALWIHSFDLKGIGVDMISVDETGDTDLVIHKILLERSILIENLTGLEQLPRTGFTFCCLPLKLEKADGSPVRAVAML